MVANLAQSLVSGLGGGGGAAKIRTLTPMGNMTTANGIAEIRQIRHLTKVPRLRNCNESKALEYEKKATEATANLFYAKKIVAAQKSRLDTAKDSVANQLDLRMHGVKTAVAVAQMAGNHRISTLQEGYGIQQAAEKVSAWEGIADRSRSMMSF